MGPPLMTMAGISRRAAAMSMPGTTFVAVGDQDEPVKGMGFRHDFDGVGNELAARQEYFIPS